MLRKFIFHPNTKFNLFINSFYLRNIWGLTSKKKILVLRKLPINQTVNLQIPKTRPLNFVCTSSPLSFCFLGATCVLFSINTWQVKMISYKLTGQVHRSMIVNSLVPGESNRSQFICFCLYFCVCENPPTIFKSLLVQLINRSTCKPYIKFGGLKCSDLLIVKLLI